MSYDEKAYIAAGSAEIEARSNALIKLMQEGYFKGCYWLCENDHKFAHDNIFTPRCCTVCRTKMIRWVPNV